MADAVAAKSKRRIRRRMGRLRFGGRSRKGTDAGNRTAIGTSEMTPTDERSQIALRRGLRGGARGIASRIVSR